MIRRGRFVRWQEKEYAISSKDKQVYLTTTDMREVQNGFTQSGGPSGLLMKKVEMRELDDAYEIVPYALVEGYRFAIETLDEDSGTVKLVTNNAFAAKKLDVHPYGTGEFMIELPIEQVVLEEDRIPILGFENKFV